MMPKATIKQAIDMAHQHDVYVSTGDWAEHMVSKSPSSFKEYVEVSLCPPDSILILVLVVVLFCDELWFFISDLIIFLKLWFLTVLNDIVVWFMYPISPNEIRLCYYCCWFGCMVFCAVTGIQAVGVWHNWAQCEFAWDSWRDLFEIYPLGQKWWS